MWILMMGLKMMKILDLVWRIEKEEEVGLKL